MQCAACHRYINKPSALSNGMPIGPVCAARMGLIQPRQKRITLAADAHGHIGRAVPVLLGQLRLQFEEVAA